MIKLSDIVRFSKDLNAYDYITEKGEEAAIARLGGKGQGLVAMTLLGIRVPPGFIIGTDWCNQFQQDPEGVMEAAKADLPAHRSWMQLSSVAGKDHLVSVRSGAPVSMPGMMDTILNVGLTKETMGIWEKKLGRRTMLDCYRRLISMLGTTAYDIPADRFAMILDKMKNQEAVNSDKDLNANALEAIIAESLVLFKASTGKDFPDTVEEQLLVSIETVFKSWNSERAKIYRKLEGIPDDLGTAVTVQMMAFGNLNEQSGTGVMFSRNPNTGENTPLIEYLDNAQGEDVVAGIRTPYTPTDKKMLMELKSILYTLEQMYQDMVDVEFTVQDGVIYVLQSRKGKRTARAAVKVWLDMDGSLAGFKKRVTRKQLHQLFKPQLDPSFKAPPMFEALGASAGFAQGEAVFSAQAAIDCNAAGRPCILVRSETSPDDIGGMEAAKGVLTATGGSTSHAAVVARGRDKPCVVGCTALTFHEDGTVDLGDVLREGDKIAIDGDTGRVWRDVDLPVISAEGSELVAKACESLMYDLAKRGIEIAKQIIDPYASTFLSFSEVAADALVLYDLTLPSHKLEDSDLEFLDSCGKTVDLSQDLATMAITAAALQQAPDNCYALYPYRKKSPDLPAKRRYGPAPVSVGEALFKTTPCQVAMESIIEVGRLQGFHKLRAALKKSGTVAPLFQVVPLEYALFSVLAD